jgi:hypothetical protein
MAAQSPNRRAGAYVKGFAMPYQGLADGFYFAVQRPATKRVDHYGILDIGNRRGAPSSDGLGAVILHQRPPGITANWLRDTGDWLVLHKIEDEAGALERLRIALTDPAYAVLRHNCEHFVRFVAFGVWESKQLQGAVGLAGLAVVAIAAFHSERPRSRPRRKRTRSARAA